MALLTADFGFDLYEIDLNFYDRNFVDDIYSSGQNFSSRQIAYPDLYEINGDDGLDDLGFAMFGSNYAFTNEGAVVSGTVEAIDEFVWPDGPVLWAISGISLALSDVVDAALTLDNDDDLALVEQALSGADVLDMSDEDDVMNGFAGNDTLYGDGGDDVLLGGVGADRIEGGTGFDYAAYSDAGSGVRISLNGTLTQTGDAAGDVLVDIEGLVGSGFADYLQGDSGDNDLFGFGGADTIEGGLGADLILGGDGGDLLIGDVSAASAASAWIDEA